MKKVSLIFIGILIFSLIIFVGCESPVEEDVVDEEPVDEEVVDEPEEVIEIRLAGQSPVDNPDSVALEEIAEQVAADSGGRISITVYPANQLGDYTTVHEEIMRGTIEMALISTSPEHDDRLLLSYMPYIAENYDQVRELYAPGGFLYDTYKDIHNDLDAEFLGFWAEGLGVLGTTEIPNEPANPEVDKGILLRVPPVDGVRLSVEAQGYRGTEIAYADLFSALETGIADGWTGGGDVLNYTGFRDVIDYIVPVNNFFEATFFLASYDFWHDLAPEDQEIIRNAVEEKSSMSLEQVEVINMEYRERMQEEGIEIIDLTDEEVSYIAEYVRERTWPQLAEDVGEDLIAELEEILEGF